MSRCRGCFFTELCEGFRPRTCEGSEEGGRSPLDYKPTLPLVVIDMETDRKEEKGIGAPLLYGVSILQT